MAFRARAALLWLSAQKTTVTSHCQVLDLQPISRDPQDLDVQTD